MVRSVRSINTMAGIRKYVIGISCNVGGYPGVVNSLGVDDTEVCYIYTKNKRNCKSGKLLSLIFMQN